MAEEDKLLTVVEVAERLSVAPDTVRRWLREKRIAGVRLGGTKTGWRVPASAVRAFIEANLQAAKTA